MAGKSLFERYAPRFGVPVPDQPVTLGEGGTPLLPSVALGPAWGLRRLLFKSDHLNPTGSYKDRFAVFAINAMRSRGQRVCLATSSGNTGAALAAYGARAGVRVVLAITEVAPEGKLAQMAAHGAELLRLRGFGVDPAESDRIFARLRELAERHGVPLLISAFCQSPEAMRGVSTAGHEILEALGGPPGACFAPVGGGGLFSALAMGFDDHGVRVRMEPVQPAGNDTVVSPLRAGLDHAVPVTHGRGTSISGLSVPTDLDGTRAVRHAAASGGCGFVVDEAFVREIQAELYRREGLSVEPAGAVAVAGVKQALDEGRLDPGETVVAMLTGQGFKDPVAEQAVAARAPVRVAGLEDLTDELLSAAKEA